MKLNGLHKNTFLMDISAETGDRLKEEWGPKFKSVQSNRIKSLLKYNAQ